MSSMYDVIPKRRQGVDKDTIAKRLVQLRETVYGDSVNIVKLKKEKLIEVLQNITSQLHATIIYDNKPLRSDIHPTMKPVSLVGKLIKNSI
jgi:DNA modification methylase